MKIIISLLMGLGLLISQPAMAAPASKYWAIWDKSDETSRKTIDHSDWSYLLSQYLKPFPDGSLFAYGKVSNAYRKKLQDYIGYMTALEPRDYNRKEQLAYWINLYNALTIELILKHYPVESITKIGPWFKFGPWDEPITEVAGTTLTLNNIEHRILRPLWQDKRIHYVVNCASLGCPDLAGEAYTGATVEVMMAEAAKRFIQQEKGVAFIDGKLALSRIYEWYAIDFGSKEALLRHIRENSQMAMAAKIDQYKGEIIYQYNWNLNALSQGNSAD
ncbi:hypothetical protein GZ77_16010 [Endozoicomonas montiporae]|uniref:DUF547 domain-containing protein n=2 Tax=Endozoicomonas montiporae TaxID=1027273 RepID=A0A081N5R3_9GAMM|nr:DUF547 domain-containing protein [Endozoicomonas montiporae]AMO57319.1 hypothetical protein EZMO1_3322 [Endozoicomonas montiporae CL-33]KEQ13786.1 hypothetical protein GZ77_16010 [Endozoicomonas montiporae]